MTTFMTCCSVDMVDKGSTAEDAPTVATDGGGEASAGGTTRGDTSRLAGAASGAAGSGSTVLGDAASVGLASGSAARKAPEGAADVADERASATGRGCGASDCASQGDSSAGVDGTPSAPAGTLPAPAGTLGRMESECAWMRPRKLTRGVPALRMRGAKCSAPRKQGADARKDREANRESAIDADIIEKGNLGRTERMTRDVQS